MITKHKKDDDKATVADLDQEIKKKVFPENWDVSKDKIDKKKE